MRNIRKIHGECIAKQKEAAQKAIAGTDPKELIGKYVKLGFPCDDQPGYPEKEHMWVEVEKINGNVLVGKLNNDPVYCSIRCGDEVEFTFDEIEQVYK